jgi:hypothetical protein
VNDELQRRINEHVLNGDAPSIIWAMEGQIRINTELEAKVAELERREALYEVFVAVTDEAMTEVFGQRDWWLIDPEIWGTETSYDLLAHLPALDWIPQP